MVGNEHPRLVIDLLGVIRAARPGYGWDAFAGVHQLSQEFFFLVMGDQGRWFTLWVSAPDDPDLENLMIEDYGRWAKFGAYLKEHGTDGIVTLSSPCRILQAKFQVTSFEAVMACIARFPNCSVTSETNTSVTFKVEWKNWHKYQGDFSGDRVRRHREKQRQSVTPKKRREEKRIRREEIPPPTSPPVIFHIPARIEEALKRSPRLGAVPRLQTPDFWQAQVRANGGVNFGDEVLRAEAWLAANPARAPKKDLTRFLHNWLARADRPPETEE